MGDGGISEHHRHFGNAEAFFVEEVSRMFHTLTLVKVEHGGAVHFLKPFFKVTFIDGYLFAQFFDGDGFTDMLQ